MFETKMNTESSTRELKYKAPGKKISASAWRHFKNSEDWKSAPHIFDPFYDRYEEQSYVAEAEGEEKGGEQDAQHVYFRLRMTSSRRIFADEVDKGILIDILGSETAQSRYDIVDFVVLDDDVRMVLRRKPGRCYDAGGDVDRLRDLAAGIRRKYLHIFPDRRQGRGQDLERATIAACDSCADALEECCRIHYLPLQSGIIAKPDDMKHYWFSGYVTLHGNYYWKCMRPDMFLMDLGHTPFEALRRYEKAHKEYLLSVGR